MSDVIRRLRSLAWGELVAAGMFAFATGVMVAPRFADDASVTALWTALVPLLLVLVIASAYWFLRSHGPLTPASARFFLIARIAIPVVLALAAVLVIVRPPGDALAGALCAFVWTFALIEYVNYFVVRLSYPITVWATEVVRRRTPRLMKDIRRALR